MNAQNGWVSYNIPAPGSGAFHFGSATHGAAVSKYIYHWTTDGGISWGSDSVPYPHQYNDYDAIYFINANTGWMGMAYTVVTFPTGFAGGCTYLTTNGGATWGPCMNAGPVRELIFFDQNTGYSATGAVPGIHTEGSIKKTTNGGINWYNTYGGYYFTDISFINDHTGWGIGFSGSDIGPTIEIMIRTNNGGINWTILKQDTNAIFNNFKRVEFISSNTGYYLDRYLYKSTDGGDNWIMLDTNTLSNKVRSFQFISNDTGWIGGTFGGKILKTNDGGLTWHEQTIPVASVFGDFQFLNSQTGWALSNGLNLLKTGTGGVTSISHLSSEIPADFSLHQNFPNPFNPSTSIRFDLPRQGFVSLKVFDISGREVAELVKEEMQPGVYEYNFDGRGLGSGVYFYRIAVHTDKLQSGDFIETRRMVLVK